MSWIFDIRHGIRVLTRSPGFTIPVLFVLALVVYFKVR